MATRHRVAWTHGELARVAEAWLNIAANRPDLPRHQLLTEAQKASLPADRHHHKSWYYLANNKRVMEEALTAERLRRANPVKESPAPSESAPKADAAPPLAATPHSDGGLGALLALAERLGEAFGRGWARGIACTQDVYSIKSPVEDPVGDPTEARANARHRMTLATSCRERPQLPKVLLVGGRDSTLSELGDYTGKIDLRHVSMEESPSVVTLRARTVDHAVVWAKAVGHKHQDALFSTLARNRITIVPPERGLDAVRTILNTLSVQR